MSNVDFYGCHKPTKPFLWFHDTLSPSLDQKFTEISQVVDILILYLSRTNSKTMDNIPEKIA